MRTGRALSGLLLALEFSADKRYWNTISSSPFYSVAQPWMKGYVYNTEFKVLYGRVWLDR